MKTSLLLKKKVLRQKLSLLLSKEVFERMTSMLYRIYTGFSPPILEKKSSAIRFGILGAAQTA
jgi:hypothetical protein